MSSATDTLANVAAINFTPKDSVTVNVRRIPTDLYPRIELSMPVWEAPTLFT